MYFFPVFALLLLPRASSEIGADVKCQLSKPLRKQVEVKSLNGMCLQDAVVRLSKTLRAIGNDELGITLFQEKLDKLDFANVTSGLDARLHTLTEKLNGKLSTYSELLRQSNNVIQPILAKDTKSASDNRSEKSDNSQERNSNICAQIANALSVNLRSLEWKNLHILMLKYPGKMCGPPSWAHNVGPLLLSQCDKSKNVILLIEHGMFMSEGDVAAAQMMAKTIVDMLSEMDYVTVIGLAGRGYTHCKNALLKATDINKFQLARHIDSIVRTDSNQTLEVNLETLLDRKGEIVLVHLSNLPEGGSKVKSIVDKLSTRTIVHFRTILILSDLHPYPKDMPKDKNTITLPTQNVLGYEIARLFSDLKCTNEEKKDYYLSDPYFEPYTKAMIVSIGQITRSSLLSLDVKLKDFLDDITYFNAGPDIYAILFDKNEIVWIHKNFPRMETLGEQPLKVYLSHIENLHQETVSAMINQFEGVATVTSKLGKKKIFRWKHLAYKDLIVCLVSEKDEDFLPVTKSVPQLPPNILHHRLDLMLQSIVSKDTVCSSYNRITTLDSGTVYFSPWCFQSPLEQWKLLETGSAVTVQSYMAYIKDETRLLANPGFHSSVRPEVATLSQILGHFKERHAKSPLNKFIVRRSVTGTTSGILEVYPGTIIDSNFDPKRRAWYVKALEHPGKIVFTTPYLDPSGAGYIATMSHTVYEGRAAALHSSNNPVFAILAMDITLGYFSRMLQEMFPFCTESTIKCFLMDDKGYLVFHPSLLQPTHKVEQQHLTHKELLVANDILNHEYFVKKKLCASHMDGTTQRYYQFNTSLEDVLTNIVHGEHCVKYQVAAVPGTNLFLGVVNVTCNLLRAFCPCSTMDRLCLNCQRMEQTECECPCECLLYSSGCSEQKASPLEPCPAPYEQSSTLQTTWNPGMAIQSCPTFSCKSYHTEKQCLGVVGCQWCNINSDGESQLSTPFCADIAMCFRGIFSNSLPYGDGIYNSQSIDEIIGRDWPSVGPVAGGVLTFVLILGVTLFCYRLRATHSSLEHQCLHLPTSPDAMRMTHPDGDIDTMELDQTKNMDSLLHDGIAPISPYRVSTNYRRPPGGDSDHGYSTMTPHDESEQQMFAEPLLVVGGNTETEQTSQVNGTASTMTYLSSPHHILAPVTVHQNMETNYC